MSKKLATLAMALILLLCVSGQAKAKVYYARSPSATELGELLNPLGFKLWDNGWTPKHREYSKKIPGGEIKIAIYLDDSDNIVKVRLSEVGKVSAEEAKQALFSLIQCVAYTKGVTKAPEDEQMVREQFDLLWPTMKKVWREEVSKFILLDGKVRIQMDTRPDGGADVLINW